MKLTKPVQIEVAWSYACKNLVILFPLGSVTLPRLYLPSVGLK